MNKKTLLNFWVLLLCMVVGGVSTAWGEKITNYAEIISGTQYYIGATTGGTDYYLSVDGSSISNSIAGTAVTTKASATVFSFEGSGTSWTIQFESGNYLSLKNTKDNGKVQVVENAATFTASNQSSKIHLTIGSYSIQKNNSGTQFGSYANTQTDLWLEPVVVAPSYSITAQSNNNLYGTVALEGNIITATPADGYRVSTSNPYAVSPEGSATVAQNGNVFTVTPSANTTVTINFEAIPTHVATFSVNGITSTQDFVEGSAIEFPDDPADVSGKTFVGWATAAIDGTTDEAPDFVTFATMGQADVTFYAVFAEVTPGSVQDASVTINASTENLPTSYGEANKFTEYTLNGVKFKIQQVTKSGAKIQWRAEKNENGTGTMYNTEALQNIQSVVITYDDSDSKKNFTLNLGDEENPSSGISITPSNDGNVYTYDCSGYNKNYFVLTNGVNAGYLTSIVINYKTGTPDTYSAYCTTVVAAAVEKPVITLAENPFLFYTTATITCETEGAAIKYSFDNETWNDYSSALNITATTTIYAKATKGNDESSVAQVTATKNLAETTVTIDATGITNDNVFNGTTAGSLSASVTYNEEAIEGAAVTWSGNNDEVATINASTGAVTLVGAGSVTFTATYAGNSDFSEKSTTYEMTVINDDPNAPGKQGNPYTVTQALEVINALENNASLDDKYVTGKVSQIDSYSSGSITYWISVDGTTSSQMQVYKGKGIAGANFSAVTDLELGDQVVVFGQLKKYVNGTKVTPEFNSGSRLISRTEKPASDLTKTGDITLDYKNGATAADLTEYFTTSSTGAITYTVADETVIDNADELISALKVGTTTVTVSQAATLSYKAGEIVINVTVQDTRVPATTIPAINISTLKFGAADGTISVVNPVKADDGVTFSFASDNEDVLLIDGTTYTVGEIGSAQVTVTATPSDSKLYTPVVETFDVLVEAAVKSDNEILLDYSNGSTVYGTPKSVDYAVSDGYEGKLDYVIDNDAIADVEISASAITFTPKAVGTAIVTISAPATASFNAAESVQYTLTVTAPEGGTTAPATVSPVTLDFSDNTDWGFPTSKTVTANTYTSGDYSVVLTGTTGYGYYFYGQNKCLLIGKSGATIQLPSFDNVVEQIDVAGHDNASSNVKLNIFEGETAVSTEVTGINKTQNFAIKEANQGANKTYTLKVTSDHNAQIKSIKFNFKNVAITAKLNAYGYATFCSQYPLDFSAANGYTAWQVKSISGEVVTFEKITGTIKGGQGILLKGEAGATVTMESDDSEELLNGNLLFGTTAPTYVDNDEYLGLSGNKFVKVNAGTIPAGKALLPVSVLSAGARQLTFQFEDDGETTGISEQITVNGEKSVYDLQGRKVEKTTKGLYIVNGRKVVVK